MPQSAHKRLVKRNVIRFHDQHRFHDPRRLASTRIFGKCPTACAEHLVAELGLGYVAATGGLRPSSPPDTDGDTAGALGLREFGQSEVQDLEASVLRKEQVFRFEITMNNPSVVHESGPPSYVQDLSLSPGGTHLATTRINSTATDLGLALWVTDLSRGVSTRLSHEQVPQGSPVWSADGRRLAFSTTRPNGMAIIEKPLNGSGAEHLLVGESPDEKYSNDWSADTQALLYTRQESGKNTGLWLADLSRGADNPAAVRPFADTEFNEGQGQFSPDSRWVAYASDESGRLEIYVRSFINSHEGGTRMQVSRDGGHDPRWRRDGRELFYLSNEGKLMSVKVRSGSTFQAEAPEPLFQVQDFHRVPGDFGLFRWAVSPDGERFLIATDPPSTEPISVVLNWAAEMAK